MRIYAGTSEWEVSLNVPVETDELPGGGIQFTAELTSYQYRKLYPFVKHNLPFRVMPARAQNFVKAKMINNKIFWRMYGEN